MKKIQKLFKNKSYSIHAIADGNIIRIENIPDTAFSHLLIGDGLALEISSSNIYSPCNGVISTIASTKHAFIITLDNGAELLIHIGLYHDKPSQEYFDYHVEVGQTISTQDPILTLSEEFLKSHHYKVIIPIVILNYQQHPIKSLTTASTIEQGKKIMTCK